MSEEGSGRIYQGVIAYVAVSNAREAAQFYERALDARIIDQRPVEDGRLMHCEMVINGGAFMINDTFPEHGMTETGAGSCVLHLTVNDIQSWWDRAIAAGCKETVGLHDAFWGDRYGQFEDPYGLRWGLVGPKG